MKSYIKIIILSFTLVLSVLLFPEQGKAQQGDVSFQVFYDALSPYGQWVDYQNYGYVWIPDVENDFVPYSTAGHWVLTDYGWTWVSDYDWGWAPFHYGRWDLDDYYGWFWVPDNQWGPAWVNWRSADGYYGWAPMEPGISLNLSFGRQYNRQNDHWLFVRDRDIERPDIHQYYVGQNVRNRIILNSTVIRGTYFDNDRRTTYSTGPRREDVQRATGITFKSVPIQENDRPGQTMINGQLRIFRPRINNNNEGGSKPVPARIMDIKDVKRPSERNQNNQPRNVNPQDNTIKPTVPQKTNPSIFDRRQQPQGTVNQQDNKSRPTLPPNVNPTTNDRRQQQPRIINPQTNNVPKPVVPQNVVPSVNDRSQQPQGNVNSQNKNNDPKPVVPTNVNPSTNDRKQQPRTNLNPQNTPQAKPAQPQNVNPSGNNSRERQQVVKPVENKTQQPEQTKPEEEKKKPE